MTKRLNKDLEQHQKSSDQSFFEEWFQPKLLESVRFYNEFVRKKAPNLTATDEIAAMNNLIDEEEKRSIEYIHSEKNRSEYLRKVDEVLIVQDIINRIGKPDGIKKYLASYNPTEQGEEPTEY